MYCRYEALAGKYLPICSTYFFGGGGGGGGGFTMGADLRVIPSLNTRPGRGRVGGGVGTFVISYSSSPSLASLRRNSIISTAATGIRIAETPLTGTCF